MAFNGIERSTRKYKFVRHIGTCFLPMSSATVGVPLQVNSSSKCTRMKAPPEPIENVESTLRPAQAGALPGPSLGTFRTGSLPNVAAPQATSAELNEAKVPIPWKPFVMILT